MCRVFASVVIGMALIAGLVGWQPLAEGVPTHFTGDRPRELPAAWEGIVEFFGTEIRDQQAVPANRVVTVKIDGQEKRFRRLQVGDVVERGQMIGRLDNRLAVLDLNARITGVKVVEVEKVISEKMAGEAYQRYQTIRKLGGRENQNEETLGYALMYERYKAEVTQKEKAIEQAKIEVEKAKLVLEMHDLRSPVRGKIQAIRKQAGEAVQRFETVLVIQPIE